MKESSILCFITTERNTDFSVLLVTKWTFIGGYNENRKSNTKKQIEALNSVNMAWNLTLHFDLSFQWFSETLSK